MSILFEDEEADVLRAALGAAYSFQRALDLVDSQRFGLPVIKESALAEAIKGALTMVEQKQGARELQRRDGIEPVYNEEPEDDEGDFLDDEDDEDEDE